MHRFWKKHFILVLIASLFVWLYFLVIPSLPFENFSFAAISNPDGYTMSNWLYDNGDFRYYHYEAWWIYFSPVEYDDIIRTYPPVSSLLFWIPAAFPGTSLLGVYILVFRVMIGVAFFGFLFVTQALLVHLKRSSAYLWLFFLPSVVYFLFGRFDIFVMFAVQLSVYLLFRGKLSFSLGLLAVAILMKWYAGLFLPAYLLYIVYHFPQDKARLLKAFFAFVLTLFLPLAVSMLFTGYKNTILPYYLQFNRDAEMGSLFSGIFGGSLYSTDIRFPGLWYLPEESGLFLIFVNLFFILQFSALFFVFRQRFASDRRLVFWCLLALIPFVTFAKFYSNQWILWLVPFVVLIIRSRWELFTFILFDLLNFFQFPYAYIRYSSENGFLVNAIGLARSSVLLLFFFLLILRYQREFHHPSSVPASTIPSRSP